MLLLPGDTVQQELLPTSKSSKTVTLGPGLRHTPPSTINVTTPGTVLTDQRKNALWIESNGRGHYVPAAGDLVLATVHHSSTDFYHCAITDYATFAMLPQLAFEGATKKTRPVLQTGSLVYARVSQANKHMDAELECVHSSSGKAEGLGELKDGMVFDISLGMARRLLMSKSKDEGGVIILEELGERGARFEVAIGRNGKIWVKGENVKTTIMVGRAVQETDEQEYDAKEQNKLVKRLIKQV
ncbi:MAG: exosome non-catalytic core subunit rrp40 [Chrysothrix sp. TS-e1954]|nr:MAG: exosome non-catalytic core subunit rrp40 [Chrysothrix sp. TS-e1954]